MISEKLAQIRFEVARVASNSGRNPSEIFLIGVTKTKPLEMIQEAFRSNLSDFGENYVEEFVKKEKNFHNINKRTGWHSRS